MTGCKEYVRKLAASTGAEVWTKEIPTKLRSCRTITDGSFFCGWSMSASAGTLDFGNGITVVSEDTRTGIIKYNAAGLAQWAKATAATSFSDLAVSKAGTLLAVTSNSGLISRISTAAGTEGDVLWSDDSQTKGYLEVTDDDSQIFALGDLRTTKALTDADGN